MCRANDIDCETQVERADVVKLLTHANAGPGSRMGRDAIKVIYNIAESNDKLHSQVAYFLRLDGQRKREANFFTTPDNVAKVQKVRHQTEEGIAKIADDATRTAEAGRKVDELQSLVPKLPLEPIDALKCSLEKMTKQQEDSQRQLNALKRKCEDFDKMPEVQ